MLGCRSLADYAAMVLGWKAHTFAERMRVAHRLEELRLISAEHAAGRMSFTVARDLTTLSDALARLLPGSRIKVEAVGDNIVLTGSVLNPIDANRAADIAGRYSKKKDSVVNMLGVVAKEQVQHHPRGCRTEDDRAEQRRVQIAHHFFQRKKHRGNRRVECRG